MFSDNLIIKNMKNQQNEEEEKKEIHKMNSKT